MEEQNPFDSLKRKTPRERISLYLDKENLGYVRSRALKEGIILSDFFDVLLKKGVIILKEQDKSRTDVGGSR